MRHRWQVLVKARRNRVACRKTAIRGLVDAAAGGGLERENLLPDSRCLDVA